MVPGGREVRAVADIVANSVRRYARVGKHIEHIETLAASDGGVVAYCRGTLHGAWSDGTAFAGIRFDQASSVRFVAETWQRLRSDPAAARRFQHAISAYADSGSTIISRASTAPRRVS